MTRLSLDPDVQRGPARRVAPERQRLVLLDRRRRQPKVKVAALVLEVGLDGERKPEVVAEEVLRRRLRRVEGVCPCEATSGWSCEASEAES